MSEKFNRTQYLILCEVSSFPYKATTDERAFAKECKKYLLAVLNAQVEDGEIKDPIFGCSIKSFYGHHLSWNKAKWRESASIVYNYYKASKIIEVIRNYESVFKKTIIFDSLSLLKYLADCFLNNKEINWSLAPALGQDFIFVPEVTLEDKIKEFEEMYE